MTKFISSLLPLLATIIMQKAIANGLPIAKIYGPKTGDVGIPITVSAKDSTNPDGGELIYWWNFGELATSQIVEGETANHAYSDPGIYNIVLRVENSEGLVTMEHVAINIGNVTNKPPIIEHIAPMIANTINGISFSSVAHDPDGEVLSYFLEFDDFPDNLDPYGSWWIDSFNRIKDFSDLKNEITYYNYRYRYAGNRTAKLTVIDNEGQASIMFIPITINDYNLPPVAAIVSKQNVLTNEVVEFSSGLSYDPDGVLVSYLWDFGDGRTESGADPIQHSYIDAGEYEASLMVMDYLGERDTMTQIITVNDKMDPQPEPPQPDPLPEPEPEPIQPSVKPVTYNYKGGGGSLGFLGLGLLALAHLIRLRG